jgi:hypothetical protein
MSNVERLVNKSRDDHVSKREMSMFGYSDETKRKIRRAIELNPAMEELILDIAESANIDGMSE